MKYMLGVEIVLLILTGLLAWSSKTADTDNAMLNSFFILLVGGATVVWTVIYVGFAFWYHTFI